MRKIKTTLTIILLLISSAIIIQKAKATLGEAASIWPTYVQINGIHSLDVYVVSLDGVGNFRTSNRLMLVDGALQACSIHELKVFLDFHVSAVVNVSIRAYVIASWEAYRMLVEWGKNVIIVNAHDEYLPVPEGYTKEEWTEKIADFMLNRWGTWTHTGGYPFYHVWYQNGATEEWGEQGFKALMSHIGKENVTCHPPPPKNQPQVAVFVHEELERNWHLNGACLGYWCESALSNPIDLDDFKENCMGKIYGFGRYAPGAIIRFSQNRSTFNFGTYIHLSPWEFNSVNGNPLPAEPAMGGISTAAAIWADIGEAISKIYKSYTFGEGAVVAIQRAKEKGRTAGLNQAEELLKSAIDGCKNRNYKMAISRAEQAKLAAQKATEPNNLSQIIAAIGIIIVAVSIGTYYKINRRKSNKGR